MFRSFTNPRFRRFALARLFSLVAQNALVYAIFIVVIDTQDSAIATSLYLVMSILPSVVLSLPGGVVADALPRKLVLIVVGGLRVLVVLALLNEGLALETVLVLTLALWSVWQFYTPAENASLRSIVDEEHLAGGNSALNATSIVAQLIGAGFLAPIGLKLVDANFVFWTCIALIVLASIAYGSIEKLTPEHAEGEERTRGILTGVRFLRADPAAMQAAVLMALVSSALMVMIVAVPKFMQTTLGTDASNAVYIFSPAAGGLAIGLTLAPRLTKAIGSRGAALIGYVLFGATLIALGNIDSLATFWEDTIGIPLEGIEERLEISTAMASTLLAVPFGGLGVAFVEVGTRTLLYERTPNRIVGQVLAAQSAFGSLLGIVPTLAAGPIVEHVDIDVVLVGLAVVLLGLGLVQLVRAPVRAKTEPTQAA